MTGQRAYLFLCLSTLVPPHNFEMSCRKSDGTNLRIVPMRLRMRSLLESHGRTSRGFGPSNPDRHGNRQMRQKKDERWRRCGPPFSATPLSESCTQADLDLRLYLFLRAASRARSAKGRSCPRRAMRSAAFIVIDVFPIRFTSCWFRSAQPTHCKPLDVTTTSHDKKTGGGNCQSTNQENRAQDSGPEQTCRSNS
jgi:hypothetical protein